MANVANIVLADGQGTPVNTTFSPETRTAEGQSVFVDRSVGTPLGFRRISARLATPRSGKNVVNRGTFTVEIPVIATVNGLAVVSHTLRAKVETLIPEQSTSAQRSDLFAFVKNGIANTLIQGTLRDLDGIY